MDPKQVKKAAKKAAKQQKKQAKKQPEANMLDTSLLLQKKQDRNDFKR